MAEFSRLGDILAGALARVRDSDEARAYRAWARAAGDEVAGVTRPRRLARGTLTVECESSTWAHELTYLAPVILERLAAVDPETSVKSLRFVVATRSRGQESPPPAPKDVSGPAKRTTEDPDHDSHADR